MGWGWGVGVVVGWIHEVGCSMCTNMIDGSLFGAKRARASFGNQNHKQTTVRKIFPLHYTSKL